MNGWFNGKREYYATAAMGAVPPHSTNAPPGAGQLSSEERKICLLAGVSPEDFIKAKAAADNQS